MLTLQENWAKADEKISTIQKINLTGNIRVEWLKKENSALRNSSSVDEKKFLTEDLENV